MGNFSGCQICNTFKSILNIGDSPNDVLTGGSKCIVRDSLNTYSAIQLGVQGEGVCIQGPSGINGNTTITGLATITSNATICGTGQVVGTFSSGCATLNGADVNGNGLNVLTDKLNVTSACTSTTNSTCVDNALCVTGNLNVGGCITAGADVIAFYSSDCRLKDDLNVICNTQSIVNSLTGYSFTWNEESDREGSDLGVIAQDVQEVLPSIVKERDNGYLAVDYIKLIPVLLEEVKRLNAEVEELKNIQSF